MTVSIEQQKNLGHLQWRMLAFLRKYPGAHYIAQDRVTQRVAKSLCKRGLVYIDYDGSVFAVPGWTVTIID